MNARALLLERLPPVLREDGVPRRILAVQALVVAGIAVLFLGIFAGVRLAPDIVMQGLVGMAAVAVMVLAGPKITFPFYFATWFGSAFSVPGLPVSANQLLGAGFVAAWAFSLWRRRLVLPACWPLVLLFVFTIYAVVGGFLMKAPGAPVSYQQVVYLLIAVAAASTYRTKEEFLRLVAVLLAITCALNAVGVFEFITRRDIFPEFSDYPFYANDLRINGIAKNAIQYAYISVWMLPWAILLVTESRSKPAKIAAIGAVLFLLVTSLITYNRQTPVIIAAMMIAGVPLLRYRGKALILAGMGLVGVLAAPLVIGRVVERLGQIGSEGRPDASFAVRSDKVTAAVEMIKDHPWFGIGLNNFKDIWYSYKQPGEMYVIHFEKGFQHFVDLGYLQIVTETGAVGALMFVLLVVTTLLLLAKQRKRALSLRDTFAANALAACLMGFVQVGLSMMLQDTFFIPRTYLLFGLFFATLLIARAAFARELSDDVKPRGVD